MDKSDKINQIKEYIYKIEEDLILSEKTTVTPRKL